MPSGSLKQHKFMNAVFHDPKFAAKVGVSPKVGQDFISADKATGAFTDPGLPKAIRPKLPKTPRMRGAFGRL